MITETKGEIIFNDYVEKDEFLSSVINCELIDKAKIAYDTTNEDIKDIYEIGIEFGIPVAGDYIHTNLQTVLKKRKDTYYLIKINICSYSTNSHDFRQYRNAVVKLFKETTDTPFAFYYNAKIKGMN